MTLKCHVRFGGGSVEKCRVSEGYLVTRHIPTLLQFIRTPIGQRAIGVTHRARLALQTKDPERIERYASSRETWQTLIPSAGLVHIQRAKISYLCG